MIIPEQVIELSTHNCVILKQLAASTIVRENIRKADTLRWDFNGEGCKNVNYVSERANVKA